MMGKYNYDFTVVRLTDWQKDHCCVGCPYLTKLGVHDVCYKEEFISCGIEPKYYDSRTNSRIKEKRKDNERLYTKLFFYDTTPDTLYLAEET